jgi:spore maturation protein CgeB
MRLLKIGVYYSAYLQQFYAGRAHLAAQSYELQHAALIEDCFGSSDFWTSALNDLGYQTCDLIANAESLQKRWAAENNFAYAEDNWMFDILAAQVKAFGPEALIVADYSTLTPAFLQRLRGENAKLRLVLGWCGAPYRDPAIFRAWDIALSCVPELVEDFRRQGLQCFHVNHAFAPRILKQLDTSAAPPVNFAFIGSIVKSNQFHEQREKILLELVKKTGLQIWSEIKRPTVQERRRLRAQRLAYDGVRAAGRIGIPQSVLNAAPLIRRAARIRTRPALSEYVDERIARRARPPLFGLRMFQQLHQSKVALNTHIDISSASASNMRLFEATGVGSCLLTDWRANLQELFQPDQEVITYRRAEECVEKVAYLLAHDDERRAVASAGQRRTLRDHTFAQRAAQIDGIIRAALSKVG